MKTWEKDIEKVNDARRNDPLYDLRYRLFWAMSSDIEVMSEHGDSDLSLYEELQEADTDILECYADTFL